MVHRVHVIAGSIVLAVTAVAGFVVGGSTILAEVFDERSTITVETWNIRHDNPGDGPHAWPKRRADVIEHLENGAADVIALQEVLPSQVVAIRKGLPEYGLFVRSRESDEARGEAVPILWRRDRWRLDSDHAEHFWLSETPEVPGSMSWNTACTRMVTVVRLLPVGRPAGRSPIWVFNLHLDHRSVEARKKGAGLVRDRIASRPRTMQGEPVVILGDLNARPGSPPVQALLAEGEDGSFVDAWSAIDGRTDETPRGTWNGWDADARLRRIDHILVRGLAVLAADIVRPTNDAGPLSDHWPIRATLGFIVDLESIPE
ncbi:MAG: endonuclease/exonuclease/phosphatase family protein [Phycisphaera sp.]|nr:endonuclease/exonuclease/phosphatase family protein [Phycisphaera sp.]